MRCLDEFWQVIDYLENHLEEIDYSEIARRTGIPISLYQRFFTYICGISIADYVRKRRITLAALKLLESEWNVLDLALESGYENHSAFTRAFKEQFKVPPTGITEEIYDSRAYQRPTFQENETYYVLKGRRMMADLVSLEYETWKECMLIGVSSKEYQVCGRALWDLYFQGYDKKLYAMRERQTPWMDECIGVGYLTDFEAGNETDLGNEYLVGKYFEIGTEIPHGMSGKVIPAGCYVHAQVKGKNFDDILNCSYLLIKDMVQRTAHQLDYQDFFWCEVYTCSRYCEPIERGDEEIILDWIMPCKKS